MKQQISRLMFNKYINHTFQLPKYNPTANFNWIKNHSNLPWIQLDIPIPCLIILNEIKKIQTLLVEHRDDYTEHSGWKSFCIHGKDYSATREDSYYNDSRPHTWTQEAELLMSKTVNYFKTTWPASSYSRVRVMALEPGGYVSIHRDYETAQLTAINIAITQPVGCNFVMENYGTVPFVPGSAYWLDISNNHTVFNDSEQTRWHIIVHQSLEDQNFQNQVVKSYHRLYNNFNEIRNNRN